MSGWSDIIEHYYNLMCQQRISCERARYGKQIIMIMQIASEEIKNEWLYRPSEYLWEDRFVRVGSDNFFPDPPIFEDIRTDLRLAPAVGGLYFFGNTAFDPTTGEVQYWVKIGLGSNLSKRAQSYCTYNPSTYVIGYKETPNYKNEEHKYHQQLAKVALYRNQNSKEWWMVDKETYLAMCQKSFDFFA